MAPSEDLTPRDDEVVLLPERAVWWPARHTLLVADLHLGKAETLQRSGVPVPATVGEESLSRLAGLVEMTACRRVVVLGDLLHAPVGLTADLIDAVARWRPRLGCDIDLVPGNHDRMVETVCGRWNIRVLASQVHESVDPGLDSATRAMDFTFSHTPTPEAGSFNWAGHIHPVINLRRGADRLRLNCFHFSPAGCVLPAFSRLTGGSPIRPAASDDVFVIADDRVVAVRPTG